MLVVTGANGNLGRRLLKFWEGPARALVRRESAVDAVRADAPDADIRVLDYLDEAALTDALAGADTVVHLVGILKETSNSRYEVAHEKTAGVLIRAAAAAGARRLINLSIVGSHLDSDNACLRSKGTADQLLIDGPVDATVIRVPMVLGEGDYASGALRARAHKPVNWLLRAASLEQPLYAGDVVNAVLRMADDPAFADRIVELAGPEVLSREALTQRAARCVGKETRVRSLPLFLGMTAAALLELLPNPPVTRAMLGVLDHDDEVDVSGLVAETGLKLTALDDMLQRCIG